MKSGTESWIKIAMHAFYQVTHWKKSKTSIIHFHSVDPSSFPYSAKCSCLTEQYFTSDEEKKVILSPTLTLLLTYSKQV